ncbi:hypothetical protein OG512_30405 [Streptomyces sp. NBC_01378]|uniref:hypothetical protein n=1 Tax=Streptomyces sp. NBC_01378 TaxID=2903844 RepID=UPI003246C39A
MTEFVASIALSYRENWAICKRESLWGVPRGKNAEKAARILDSGDSIFVWLSGGIQHGGGLAAWVQATGPATSAGHAPWPDAARYAYTIPITLIGELTHPISDSFPNNGASERFGIQNMWVNWGFWHVPDIVSNRLKACFTTT